MEEDNYASELESLFHKEEKEDDEVTCYQRFKRLAASFVSIPMVVISSTCIQLLERKMPDFELTSIRMICALILSGLGLCLLKTSPWISRCEIGSTILFGLLNFSLFTFAYMAVTFLPVVSVDAIWISSGISSGIILLAIFWNEKVSVQRMGLAAVCIFEYS